MRGTKNILVIAGLAVILLASCSKPQGQETAFVPVPDMSAPIEVATTLAPATKGLDPVDDAIEGILDQHFGVFSWWNPKEFIFEALTNPANIYQDNNDVQFEADLGGGVRKWRFDPYAYWPMMCNLSFFAYAPYIEHTQPWDEGGEIRQPNLLFPSADYIQGMPRVTFSPDTSVTHQVDFCIAEPVFDRLPADGLIHFEFQHATTRIRIYVKVKGNKLPGHEYRIDDLIISGIAGTNTFTYDDNEEDDVAFIWDEVDGTTPLDGEYHLTVSKLELKSVWVNFVTDPSDHSLSTYTWVNGLDGGRLYLLPQQLTSSAKLELAMGMYRDNGGGVYTRTSILPPIEVSIPTAQAWHPGQSVAYLVTLDITNYIVLDITPLITPWVDADNTHPTQRIY